MNALVPVAPADEAFTPLYDLLLPLRPRERVQVRLAAEVPMSEEKNPSFGKWEPPAPADVARWAGLSFLDGSPISGDRPMPRNVAEGLKLLDEVAAEGSWRDPTDLWIAVSADARWVFGHDMATPRQRLRAAIARVAWDHDRRSHRLHAGRAAVEEAEAAANAIRTALMLLDGCEETQEEKLPGAAGKRPPTKIIAGIDALRRLLAASPPEWFAGLLHDACAAAAALQDVMWTLDEAAAAHKREGRPPETARLFLFVRLAEIYAALSGERPSFHAKGLVADARPRTLRRWLKFVQAATMVVLARELTKHEIDGTLRRINARPPIADVEGKDDGLPPGMAPQRTVIRMLASRSFLTDPWRGQFTYAELGSVGLFDLHFDGFGDAPPF